ncbi:hypothetical protein FWK35_00001795 [Aphis craccivora]|uniref:Uncharacterized protein n=1 Tax=Aphis craccivora TaxID=307492 RepID=A0A6G0ZCQ7_APHCR|nr:hypothetical protein FWK35_00001795 [Aphis craccivora]
MKYLSGAFSPDSLLGDNNGVAREGMFKPPPLALKKFFVNCYTYVQPGYSNCNYYLKGNGQIALELKNGNIMVELHLGSKKVFPQNYHAFEVYNYKKMIEMKKKCNLAKISAIRPYPLYHSWTIYFRGEQKKSKYTNKRLETISSEIKPQNTEFEFVIN